MQFPDFLRGSIRRASSHAPASQVLVVTERKFERRALNRIFQNGPHLTSRAKPLLEFRAPNDLSASELLPAKSMPQNQTDSTTCKSSCSGAERQTWPKWALQIEQSQGFFHASACFSRILASYFVTGHPGKPGWFPAKREENGQKNSGLSMGEYDSRTFSERGSPSHL
jgi:hypothetical protein